MVRKLSPSQLRNQLKQAQRKTKQAIDKYNREVKRYDQQVNQAINKYNQDVRRYNSRVRANRQRIKHELAKLNRQPPQKYIIYYSSVKTLHRVYTELQDQAQTKNCDPVYNHFLDLCEQETANSLEVANVLSNSESDGEYSENDQLNRDLIDKLDYISPDLHKRWQGAVYSLSPHNPDAARHFCTSAREIITQMLELKAPDQAVINLIQNCDQTQQGKPTRKAKITYLLLRKGLTENAFKEFVEQDIQNIVKLFRVFNDGTHGSAGKFSFTQLKSIKKRVKDAIVFLTEIIC